AASGGDTVWDWHHWHAGDGAAGNAGSGVAHIRQFAFSGGMSKILNAACTTPAYQLDGDGNQVQTQPDDWAHAWSPTSIAKYGLRSWSAVNLLTIRGFDGSAPILGSSALGEVVRFAEYYRANYQYPKNRVTLCGFATMSPDQPHAAATWSLLSQVEIGELVDITVGPPGGGGFTGESFFVEGVHEQVQPLGAEYDDVTLTLDLSPQAYFDDLSMFDGG